MTSDPAAVAAYRVPRSEIDADFERGENLAPLRIGTAVVVSVDGPTCTVQVGDEIIGGVLYLGNPPRVGDVVDLESRGDLMVILATADLDTFLEGMEDDAEHIVSDEDPGKAPDQDVNVGGSMRDLDAWEFLGVDTASWVRELNDSGQGLRCYQPPGATQPSGTLWSAEAFEVEAGDIVNIEGHFADLVPVTTVQAVLLYAAVEDADYTPADPDTVVTAQGSAVTVSGTDTVLALQVTIPETVTFPVSGAVEPRTAKLGFMLTGDGDSQIVVTAARLTVTPHGWPLGSLWMNPDADVGGVATFTDTGTGPNTPITLPNAGGVAWQVVPGIKKVAATAPPESGGVLEVTASLTLIATSADAVEVAWATSQTGGFVGSVAQVAGAAGSRVPVLCRVFYRLGSGESVDLYPLFRYLTVPATAFTHARPNVQAAFHPGAVMAGASAPDPMIRYWDGDSWRPSTLVPAVLDVSQDATGTAPTKTNTTTTVTRSASTLHAGATLTLTATVSPSTATGTVTFYKATSSTGPWTSLGTSSLSGGKATRTWTATAGSYYFRATYAGSPTYNPSTSAATGATTVQSKTTHTVVLPCGWAQAYNGSGGKISGSGNDGAVHQGYYSSTHGNRKSLLRFDASTIPASADITAVTLICKSGGWDHWYNNSGGTLVVGYFLNQDTEPASWPGGKVTGDRSRHAVDVGGWSANLSSWATGPVGRSDFSGITIGPGPSQSVGYYGYSDSPGASQFSLKITYAVWQ